VHATVGQVGVKYDGWLPDRRSRPARGAWIETWQTSSTLRPARGAWIETVVLRLEPMAGRVD